MTNLIERLRLGDGTSPDHLLLLEAADALEKSVECMCGICKLGPQETDPESAYQRGYLDGTTKRTQPAQEPDTNEETVTYVADVLEGKNMNAKPMTRKEWLSYIEKTWEAAQEADEADEADELAIAYMNGLHDGKKAEREACAAKAEQVGQHKNHIGIAAAIRARGNT
jgi:hypothetical protein